MSSQKENFSRMRRLRQTPAFRNMLQETQLSVNDFMFPLFIKEGIDEKKPVSSMPGLYQLPLHELANEMREIQALGIQSVMLFGVPAHKDATGSDGFSADGIVARSIEIAKDAAPDLMVVSDICCCEYTHHGHCGFIDESTSAKDVDNDKTLDILAKQAIAHANKGADMVAPSGMMDGAVYAIRQALDNSGHSNVPIMSYSVKFASALYGPFREATEGAPQFGDRKTYQMDPANGQEALREVALDLNEGADMLMVKPALAYLDVIHHIKQKYPEVPLSAYQVSGEFAMIKAAAEKGWVNEEKVMMESLLAIKRAGADFIITYFSIDAVKYLDRM